MKRRSRRSRTALPLVHGLYMGVTGLWPIFHMRSFEAVTGPKVDRWRVKTVGALVTAIGAAMIADRMRGESSPASRVLGVGSAVALGGVDVVYAARGRISPVYLLDAAVQAGLCAAWLRRSR